MSKLHFVDAQGRHLIITKTRDDVYEDIPLIRDSNPSNPSDVDAKTIPSSPLNLRIYSRHAESWVIIDAATAHPIYFLDIAPDDAILDVYRGRWLTIRRPTMIINISGKAVDYDAADEYIFDMDSGRKMTKDFRGRISGSYISRDDRAISMNNGMAVACGFLKTMDLLDYGSISGVATSGMGMATETATVDKKKSIGTPPSTLGSSPASPSFANFATHTYVMKKKGHDNAYTVYVGPSMSANSRLSPILQFTGTYWQARGDMIAYNNQVSRLAVGGRASEVLLTFESTLVSNNLVLTLVDVYFPYDGAVCLLYRSVNFDAIIVREVG